MLGDNDGEYGPQETYGTRSGDPVYAIFIKVSVYLALPILVLLALINFAVDFLEDWHGLKSPYNYIAAFYYFTVVKIMGFAAEILVFAKDSVNTRYINLNTIIAYSLPFLYLLSFVGAGIFLKRKGYLRTVVLIWSLPCVFGVTWFTFCTIFTWLFATN